MPRRALQLVLALLQNSWDMDSKFNPLAGRTRPGILDVARLAGVSHQTVSRVINRHKSVRPETLQRVLDAMQKLDYQPNTAARALVTGRSQTIGVICYDTPVLGPTSVLFGLEQAAREAGYFVNIASMTSFAKDAVHETMMRFRQQSVAGAVIISPVAITPSVYNALPRDIPTVSVWGLPNARIPLVAVGQASGAQRITQHLLDLGHKTVHHVAGPIGWLGAEERIRAWRATLAAAGVTPPDIISGDWTAESGYQAGRIFAADPAVTAVFAANDQMALGVLRAMQEAGRDVPADVSVAGFDDLADSAYYTPPLTTVHQDFHALGRRSFALLLDRMNGRKGPADERVVLPAELIVRASTAAPKRTGTRTRRRQA